MHVQRLYHRLRDAVVTLTSFYPDAPSCNASGFLVEWADELHVVTAAHEALFSSVTDPNRPLYVGIYNVNGIKGANFVYPAHILGVDASADVAVLDLCHDECERCVGHKETNRRTRPTPGRHPSIRFQDSHSSRVGDAVFNISFSLAQDVQSFVQGTIRHVRWFDAEGNFIVPCLTTNLLVYTASVGSPVLDACTGRCLGLVSFNSWDPDSRSAEGFSGGCDSHTMLKIVRDILKCKHVQRVTADDGQQYLTHLKGYLGDVHWLGVNSYTLASLYPKRTCALEMRGVVLTRTDPEGPLSRLLDGAPPLAVGDILVWGELLQSPEPKRYTFGGGQGQVTLGELLWQINPRGRDNVVRFGVIRNPGSNSCVEKVCASLNLINDPQTETPPSTPAMAASATRLVSDPGVGNRLSCMSVYPIVFELSTPDCQIPLIPTITPSTYLIMGDKHPDTDEYTYTLRQNPIPSTIPAPRGLIPWKVPYPFGHYIPVLKDLSLFVGDGEFDPPVQFVLHILKAIDQTLPYRFQQFEEWVSIDFPPYSAPPPGYDCGFPQVPEGPVPASPVVSGTTLLLILSITNGPADFGQLSGISVQIDFMQV